MNRAERRRMEREQKKPEKVYTLTQSQIDQIKEDAKAEAVETALILLLAIPTEVLIGDDYWAKSAKRRIPKFLDDMESMYQAWVAGTLSLEDMREDIWKFGGRKIEVDKRVQHY